MPDERFPLNVPRVDPVAHARNPLQVAVCELRFPTLLELEERGPGILQKRLRKIYPHFEPGTAIGIGPGTAVQQERRFLFRSKRRDWTVAFRASALSLEASSYTDFRDFRARLVSLLEITASLIDSDFFTRVGLRYINTIPTGPIATGWINPMLVAPLDRGIYGRVNHFWQEVRGDARFGNYSFRHGFSPEPKEIPEYVLDFDFYEENVDANAVLDRVSDWNVECYSFFAWAIGEKTRAFLDNRPQIVIREG
jgi:uncharacterized protein (TIGR04255 family)